jgi:hypothetical protein
VERLKTEDFDSSGSSRKTVCQMEVSLVVESRVMYKREVDDRERIFL